MKKVLTPLRVLALGLMLGTLSVQAQDVSAEMSSFLKMINGTEEAAEAAITKYGSAEVIDNGMIPYGKSPKVTSTEGNCYTVAFSDEGETNEYVICWEKGKIISFEWAMDESEEDWGDE